MSVRERYESHTMATEMTQQQPASPPPSYSEATYPQTGRGSFCPLPSLSDVEAREALIEHANKNCCYGKSPALRVDIRGLDTAFIYKYIVESYSETRKIVIQSVLCEPGHVLDGPHNGPVPNPCEIPMQPTEMFKQQTVTVKIPRTESIKTCQRCVGAGKTTCIRCGGAGWVGRISLIPVRPCYWCAGSGTRTCCECCGRGSRIFFATLEVTWEVYKSVVTCYSDNWRLTAITDKQRTKLNNGADLLIFEHQDAQVPALTRRAAIPHELYQTSQATLEHHKTKLRELKVIQQRHSLSVIPVTEVTYLRKGKTDTYKVYGTDQKVMIRNYEGDPCTIL